MRFRTLFRAAAASLIASPLAAQKVILQIHPHVGDTIRMHLTQTVEISGKPRAGGASSAMTTSTEIFSRAIPFQWTSSGTLIHAITDSVIVVPAPGKSRGVYGGRNETHKSPAVLRVASDGAIEVVDDGDPQSEVRHLFAEMPPTLPRTAVAVGERWTKEMQIPLAGEPGASGTVKATLRLDSLSRSGEIAYVSIHGTLARLAAPSGEEAVAAYKASGTFTGSMQIDRALGWITDARSVVSMRSEIMTDGSARNGPKRPVQVHTKVSVWARAMKTR